MRTEKTFSIVFIVGFLFKVMHLPSANAFLLISLLSLAFMYFPLGFYFFSDKNVKQQNLPLSIVSGGFLAVIPMGILFKLLHFIPLFYWPGGINYFLIGMLCGGIVLVAVLLFQSKASHELKTYYKNMVKRATVLTALAILFCVGSFF